MSGFYLRANPDGSTTLVPLSEASPEMLVPVACELPRIRTILADAFLARFTDAEFAALDADPKMRRACLAAGFKRTVNLDSPRLPELLAYAVSKGFLDAARLAQIMADGSPSEV